MNLYMMQPATTPATARQQRPTSFPSCPYQLIELAGFSLRRDDGPALLVLVLEVAPVRRSA